ncbi:MAG: hypothetical protein ACJ76I_12915 [Gaiellaceae bacterium]
MPTGSTIALFLLAGVALVSDAVAGKLRRTGTGAKLRRFATGGVFVVLGLTAAAARRST